MPLGVLYRNKDKCWPKPGKGRGTSGSQKTHGEMGKDQKQSGFWLPTENSEEGFQWDPKRRHSMSSSLLLRNMLNKWQRHNIRGCFWERERKRWGRTQPRLRQWRDRPSSHQQYLASPQTEAFMKLTYLQTNPILAMGHGLLSLTQKWGSFSLDCPLEMVMQMQLTSLGMTPLNKSNWSSMSHPLWPTKVPDLEGVEKYL